MLNPVWRKLEQLLKLSGSYTHRVALKQPPYCVHGQDTVCFRWRDYADGNKQKVMCLSHEEFIRRFCSIFYLHGFVRYASTVSCQPAAKAGFGTLPASFRVKPPPQLPALSGGSATGEVQALIGMFARCAAKCTC